VDNKLSALGEGEIRQDIVLHRKVERLLRGKILPRLEEIKEVKLFLMEEGVLGRINCLLSFDTALTA
jgi:hypothetical protein